MQQRNRERETLGVLSTEIAHSLTLPPPSSLLVLPFSNHLLSWSLGSWEPTVSEAPGPGGLPRPRLQDRPPLASSLSQLPGSCSRSRRILLDTVLTLQGRGQPGSFPLQLTAVGRRLPSQARGPTHPLLVTALRTLVAPRECPRTSTYVSASGPGKGHSQESADLPRARSFWRTQILLAEPLRPRSLCAQGPSPLTPPPVLCTPCLTCSPAAQGHPSAGSVGRLQEDLVIHAFLYSRPLPCLTFPLDQPLSVCLSLGTAAPPAGSAAELVSWRGVLGGCRERNGRSSGVMKCALAPVRTPRVVQPI